MGVTCLVRWKNATGMRDFTYIAEHVTKTLQGKNTGPWSLSFKVFRDINNNKAVSLKDSKLLYQVSLGQQPGNVYCMVDGSVVVEAGKEMEIILSRLKNLWQLRQNVTIEGTSYEIGDFTLRVANILLGSTYKGLLLEVKQRNHKRLKLILCRLIIILVQLPIMQVSYFKNLFNLSYPPPLNCHVNMNTIMRL
ncbi:unnamed protein product [Rhizopus stolonifer]